jgi:hypothetical protein
MSMIRMVEDSCESPEPASVAKERDRAKDNFDIFIQYTPCHVACLHVR